MKKLFLVLALFVSTSANAAYFYENPSNQGIRNVFDTRVQQEAHLYTEKEYNQKQADSSGIPDLKATWIPNTVWDLFMYRSHIRSRLIKQREWHDYVDLGIHLKKSAEFLEWIGQRGFNEQLAQKIYSEIIERLLSEIAAIELDTFPIIPRWKADDLECLFAYSQDPRLAEIRKFLLRVAEVEVQAQVRDQIPLFRFSRVVQRVHLLEKERVVIDLSTKDSKVGLVSPDQSFSYSPLAAVLGDGTINPLLDQLTASACTFSYFAADLRDRKFTFKELPFVPALADWVGSDAHPDRLGNSFVYAIFLDRKEIAEAEENWLLPKGDLNVQIYSKGESFHPRLKGILAPKGEYGLRGIGKFSGQENPQVLEKASIALLGEFARRIQTAEWIYVDGKVVQGPQESVLVQQGLQDLGAITELMKDSANHPAILKSLLKSRR